MSVLALAVEIGYSVGTLATWCAGAFGIGASRSDLKRQAQETAAARKAEVARRGMTHMPATAELAGLGPSRGEDFRFLMVQSWGRTIGAGVVWPVSVPMYLAYRKGCYVDTTVVKRGELSILQGRISELTSELCELETKR